MHAGAADHARRLARTNLRAFPDDVDAIVTNAASGGSRVKEYDLLFQGEPEQEEAERARAGTRALLGAIPNVKLVTPTEWELCRGSAGTYNVERPQVANRLGETQGSQPDRDRGPARCSRQHRVPHADRHTTGLPR
jgi:glycolate oxidase iron-sulfur subunit